MEIAWLPFRDFEARLRKRAESDSPCYARMAGSLLNLVTALRDEPMGPTLTASYYVDRELWLTYRAPNGASCHIKVFMDRADYGPLENGLPRFHYRMTYRITDNVNQRTDRTIEDRARSVESATEFVRQAISETRSRL